MQLNSLVLEVKIQMLIFEPYGPNQSGRTHLELWGCAMMVPAPVEATSPADIGLVLREMCFISGVINKYYYPTHSPNV